MMGALIPVSMASETAAPMEVDQTTGGNRKANKRKRSDGLQQASPKLRPKTRVAKSTAAVPGVARTLIRVPNLDEFMAKGVAAYDDYEEQPKPKKSRKSKKENRNNSSSSSSSSTTTDGLDTDLLYDATPMDTSSDNSDSKDAKTPAPAVTPLPVPGGGVDVSKFDNEHLQLLEKLRVFRQRLDQQKLLTEMLQFNMKSETERVAKLKGSLASRDAVESQLVQQLTASREVAAANLERQQSFRSAWQRTQSELAALSDANEQVEQSRNFWKAEAQRAYAFIKQIAETLTDSSAANTRLLEENKQFKTANDQLEFVEMQLRKDRDYWHKQATEAMQREEDLEEKVDKLEEQLQEMEEQRDHAIEQLDEVVPEESRRGDLLIESVEQVLQNVKDTLQWIDCKGDGTRDLLGALREIKKDLTNIIVCDGQDQLISCRMYGKARVRA